MHLSNEDEAMLLDAWITPETLAMLDSLPNYLMSDALHVFKTQGKSGFEAWVEARHREHLT